MVSHEVILLTAWSLNGMVVPDMWPKSLFLIGKCFFFIYTFYFWVIPNLWIELWISTLSSSATEKNVQTCEDMFTNDDVMSTTQAESHCNLKQVTCSRKGDESQINQTDWFILQQAYFIGSRYRISFIYRSNKNDVIFCPINIAHP